MVLTVCDPLLLLNGRCNNRSHSSPAGPCSRSQLLYMCGHMRGVCICVSGLWACLLCALVCVWPGCALWPLCHQRNLSELHVGELIPDDTVMAPCWAAPSSAAILVGLYRPPTLRIDGGKDKLQDKHPSGARKGRKNCDQQNDDFSVYIYEMVVFRDRVPVVDQSRV